MKLKLALGQVSRISAIAVCCALMSLHPAPAKAQFVGGGGEIFADTILDLEDLKAQCTEPEERAAFQYAQSWKRLAWYRSEYYSPIDEKKMETLAFGIVQKDTGRPALPGYRDIRDVPLQADTTKDPYALARSNYKNFYWPSKPKPRYGKQECKTAAKNWLREATNFERELPAPFSEVRKYLDLAYPNDLLAISKRMHVCGNNRGFSSANRFEAWISTNFSVSYGRREKVSPVILRQLQLELRAYGTAGEAAEKISFGAVADARCPTLDSAINAYDARVPEL